MRKWGGVILVLMVVYLALAVETSAQEVSSHAPYLYYYSDVLNAFVIERADGTDSRVFGDGLMPEGTDYVDGPGWSPSGEWFAWTTAPLEWVSLATQPESTPMAFQAWAIGADGRKLTVLDRMHKAALTWSPIDDLLFVLNRNGETFVEAEEGRRQYKEIEYGYYLIDPETDTILWSHSEEHYEGSVRAFWTSDGQHVIVAYDSCCNAPSRLVTFTIIGHGGDLHTREFFDNFPMHREWPYFETGISTFGDIIWKNIIENVTTDTQISLDSLNVKADSRAIWSPDSEYALIYGREGTCLDNCPTKLWLLSLNSRTVDLIHFDVMENGLKRFNDELMYWSPDGQYAFFFSTDGGLFQLTPPTKSSYLLIAGNEYYVNQQPKVQWLSSDKLALFVQNPSVPSNVEIRVFDLERHSFSSFMLADHQGGHLVLTPDMRYVVTPDPIFDNLFLLTELATGRQFAVPPYTQRQLKAIRWHTEDSWGIFAEQQLEINDFVNKQLITVFDFDNHTYRALGRCKFTRACADWLPDRVNPEAVANPIALPHPQLAFVTYGITSALSWSPDNRFLLAHSQRYFVSGSPAIFVYDISTRATSERFALEDYQQIIWVHDEQGQYRPTFLNESLPYWVISPDESQYIEQTGRYPHEFAVRSVKDGALLYQIPYSIFGASYSADGQWLALAGRSEYVKIMNSESWEVVAELNTIGTAVAFSPDRTKLAVASSWDVQIWDVAELLAWGREQAN